MNSSQLPENPLQQAAQSLLMPFYLPQWKTHIYTQTQCSSYTYTLACQGGYVRSYFFIISPNLLHLPDVLSYLVKS